MMETSKKELEVKFLTNLPTEYQISDSNFITIPLEYDKDNLNKLVKQLLKLQNKNVEKNFEFFVENKIVDSDLLNVLTENNLLKKYSEAPLEVYYFFELSEPNLVNTIKEDEWIKKIVMRNRDVLGKYCVGLFNSEISFYNDKFEKILDLKQNLNEEEEGKVDILNDLLFYKVDSTNILITSSRFDSEKLKIYTVNFKDKKVEPLMKEYKQSDEYLSSLSINILSPQFFAGGDSQGSLMIYKIDDNYLNEDKENGKKRKKKDVHAISPVSILENCHNEIKMIKWLNTNQIASIGNDFNIKVFNINTNAQFSVMSAQYSVPTTINSNNEYLFSGHEDGKVRVWDLRASVKAAFVFNSHNNYVSDLKVSPLSTQLFTTIGYDGTIKLFDLRANKPLWTVNTENEKNFALEFNSARFILTGGESANVNVYEINI